MDAAVSFRTGHRLYGEELRRVRYRTSPEWRQPYSVGMILKNTSTTVSVTSIAWLLTVIAMGVIATVDSLYGWLLLGVVALGPGIVLLHFTKQLPRTTSQSIQEAQR
jgi:hypothetical protein